MTGKKVKDYRPARRNANKHTARGMGALQQSVQTDGWIGAMTAAADGEMIAGSARIETVAQVFGTDAEPIIVETDGTRPVLVVRTDIPTADDKRAQRLALADNRVQEMDLTWDVEVLAGFDADVLGELWTPDELSDLGQQWADEQRGKQEDAGAEVDKAEELRVKWGVESGQLWQLGEHRLICGDCTDKATVDRLMAGERAQAVVTDPPYGQNQAGVTNDEPEKLAGIVNGCIETLPCDNAVIVAFSSPRTFPMWLDGVRAQGHKFERMLWLYKAAQETFPWRGWLLKSEAIVVSSKGDGQWQDVHPYSHDCYYKSEVSGELAPDSGWHGSVKPLDVVQDLVNRVSASGAIVYEPFSGSGTTLIACERLGRKCRAVEISPAYCAVALERWAQTTGKTPKLI